MELSSKKFFLFFYTFFVSKAFINVTSTHKHLWLSFTIKIIHLLLEYWEHLCFSPFKISSFSCSFPPPTMLFNKSVWEKTMIMVSVIFISKYYQHFHFVVFSNEIILYSIHNKWLKFPKYFHKELFSLYNVELLINLKKLDCYFCIIGCIWRNNKDAKIINYLVKIIFFAKYITFIQNFFAQRKSCSKF